MKKLWNFEYEKLGEWALECWDGIVWNNGHKYTVFENHRKSLHQRERSELRLQFESQKVD